MADRDVPAWVDPLVYYWRPAVSAIVAVGLMVYALLEGSELAFVGALGAMGMAQYQAAERLRKLRRERGDRRWR